MDTKEKILTAASDLFLEGGASALSVRAIAKRAGISTIGIYSHFQGKQGILDSLYIEGFDHVTKAVGDLEIKGDPSVAILEATDRYCELAQTHRAHYKLIFGESEADYTPSEEAKEAARQSFGYLVQKAGNVLPDGATRNEQQEFALGLWALIHGFVTLQHHAVNNMMPSVDWRTMIHRAVKLHLKAGLALKDRFTGHSGIKNDAAG